MSEDDLEEMELVGPKTVYLSILRMDAEGNEYVWVFRVNTESLYKRCVLGRAVREE